MVHSINWFGLAAGVITLIVLAVSLYLPWWQLTIGDNLIKVNASPIYTNFGVFGDQFTVPIIWVLNLISILTFTASGLIMLIYSLIPTKPYAKHLLGFAYRKPLWAVLGFVIGLVAIILIAGNFGVHLPINGSAMITVSLPSSLSNGATVTALVSGSLEISFWLAIAAAALCIGARFFHGRFAKILDAAAISQTSTFQAPAV